MTNPQIYTMFVAELRRYAVNNGYGITYLSERKKDEIIAIIESEDAKADARKEKK